MLQKNFPILEYDKNTNPLINPKKIINSIEGIFKNCTLCFFTRSIEQIIKEYPNKIIYNFIHTGINFPLYELDYKGSKIGLINAAMGSSIAAIQIEELSAIGIKKIISCGSCGVLTKELTVGHLIIPNIAIRDEGTSYHYIEPSREISVNEHILEIIEKKFIKEKIPYVIGKTWTTDAPFRETPEKIELRKNEGCITVEMELSANLAVSQYNNIEFGQILCSQDSLAGPEWDRRNYKTKEEIREALLKLTLDICLEL